MGLKVWCTTTYIANYDVPYLTSWHLTGRMQLLHKTCIYTAVIAPAGLSYLKQAAHMPACCLFKRQRWQSKYLAGEVTVPEDSSDFDWQ